MRRTQSGSYRRKYHTFRLDSCLLTFLCFTQLLLLSATAGFAQTQSERRAQRIRAAEQLRAAEQPALLTFSTADNAATVTLPFEDDFESGTGDWTATGFFNLITNAQNNSVLNPDINPRLVTLPDNGKLPAAYSGKGMWWFGQKETGTFIGSDFKAITQVPKNGGRSTSAKSGLLISPPIDLTGVTQAQLRFKTWWEIEGVDVDIFDLMLVEVSTNEGVSFSPLGSGTLNPLNDVNGEAFKSYSSGGLGLPGVWLDQLFNLSPYTGETVLIRFTFDTGDALYNGFRGWFIDDVEVTGGGLPTPTIISIVPPVAAPASLVTINGTNFINGAVVKIGNTVSSAIISTKTAVVTVPDLSPGQYDVTITNPGGKSATKVKGLTITNTSPPVITAIEPGTATCGSSVSFTITGENFTSQTDVAIGDLNVTTLTFVNANTIQGQSPDALGVGIYNVTVTNPDGQFDRLISEFEVTQGQKQNQTISFPAIPDKEVGDPPFTVNATASSGLPITYSISSSPEGIATITGNTITVTGAGTVTVTASQSGNCEYNQAQATRSFTVDDVGKLDQTITFSEIPDKTYGDAPFALSATASSGLSVSFEIVSQDPAGIFSLSGSTVTINGAGTVTIKATQPGNDTYSAAPAVERTVLINKASLTVTAADKTKVQGAANPPLTYAYSGFVNGDDAEDINTPPVATTTATAGSPAGTYPITVSGGSDNNYSFSYVAGTLTITGGPVPDDIFRINAGGSAYSTADGRNFSADAYFSGGNRSLVVTGNVAGTAADALYQTGRHGGRFSYNIPISSGAYYVVLHFAETYWGNAVPGGVGSRKFHVDIERDRLLNEYDIYARAGGAMKAVQESFRVTVYDNMLNINFFEGSADFPAVKAIEVYAETAAGARVAAAGSSPEAALLESAGVFPNPVQDRLRVSLSVPAVRIKGTFVTDASGTECLRNAHRVAGENELEMNVSGLKTGLYLLRLESAKGYRTLKFIKR